MPLYLVEATVEAVVEANTHEEAAEIANKQQAEIIADARPLVFWTSTHPLSRDEDGHIRPWLPEDWDETTIPYGHDRIVLLTIGQILDKIEEEETP